MLVWQSILLFLVGCVLSKSPTNLYTPGYVQCPEGKLTRSSLDGINSMKKHILIEGMQMPKVN